MAAPHIEVVATPVVDAAVVAELMTAADRARLANLVDPAARDRVATGRALLRAATLARTGGVPDDATIGYRCALCGGPHGKPVVQLPSGADPVHASVSAAGSVVLVALADVPVGVDVEQCVATAFPGFDSVALSARERATFDPPAPERYAELWVRKEAVLKIGGLGLSVPASDVHVGRVGAGPIRVSHSIAAGGWASVLGVPVPAGYRAAAAVTGPVTPTLTVRVGRALLATAVTAARAAMG